MSKTKSTIIYCDENCVQVAKEDATNVIITETDAKGFETRTYAEIPSDVRQAIRDAKPKAENKTG